MCFKFSWWNMVKRERKRVHKKDSFSFYLHKIRKSVFINKKQTFRLLCKRFYSNRQYNEVSTESDALKLNMSDLT